MRIADLPGRQATRYLRALQAFEPQRQLLIKIGGGLLEDEAAILELSEALTELAANQVHAVIVHGGGVQLNAALQRYNVEPHFIDGKRYTDEATLKLAKATFRQVGQDLKKSFQAAGLDAVITDAAEMFQAKRDQALGYVGTEITQIDTEHIIEAAQAHPVLIINSLARDETNAQTLNVNADTIFRALATELRPHRMVSLTPTGGVLKPIEGTNTEELITGINVRDIEALISDGIVSGGMALKLRELATVLEGLEVGSAISITKPSELLLELLTDQGSGTFVCKGQKIIQTEGIADLLPDLSALVIEAFGKGLPTDYAEKTFEKIYFTGDRQAFGVVTRLSDGTPYLDKLAVSPQLQGRGIGESLWYIITKDYPQIVWRSHVNNRYATWYHRHADIMKRSGEWILFGKGVDFTGLAALEQELVGIPAMN